MSDYPTGLRVPDTPGKILLAEGGGRVLIAATWGVNVHRPDTYQLGVCNGPYPAMSGRYNLGTLISALRYAQILTGGGYNQSVEVQIYFCHTDEDDRRPLAIRIGDSRTVLIVDPAGERRKGDQ